MKIVALMALADRGGLPSLLFTLLLLIIAADFQVAALISRQCLRVTFCFREGLLLVEQSSTDGFYQGVGCTTSHPCTGTRFALP